MLSNDGLCLQPAAQYVLLFLVWFNNSDQFQIYKVTRSYSSHPFLCALDRVTTKSDGMVITFSNDTTARHVHLLVRVLQANNLLQAKGCNSTSGAVLLTNVSSIPWLIK